MTNLYFLSIALPPIAIGSVPEIRFEDFDVLVRNSLSHGDLHAVQILRRYYDILNIRAFWLKGPLEPYGNWNENELQDAILQEMPIPAYLANFLDRYSETADRLKNFPELIEAYFRQEAPLCSGFAKQWLEFERQLRLVLVAFRAKRLNRDILQELQFEDPNDPLVRNILAQRDAPDFTPPERFEAIRQFYHQFGDDPLKLHQALYEFRFNEAEALAGNNLFSLDYVLSYMIQLILLIKWFELNQTQGIQIVDSIIEEKA